MDFPRISKDFQEFSRISRISWDFHRFPRLRLGHLQGFPGTFLGQLEDRDVVCIPQLSVQLPKATFQKIELTHKKTVNSDLSTVRSDLQSVISYVTKQPQSTLKQGVTLKFFEFCWNPLKTSRNTSRTSSSRINNSSTTGV